MLFYMTQKMIETKPNDVAPDKTIKNVLSLYKKDRISLSRAAELLDVSTFDVLRLAQEKGIHIGATDMQQEKSRGTATELTL